MGLNFLGKIDEKPSVQKFEENEAHFFDGSSSKIDVVIFSTDTSIHIPTFGVSCD